MTPDDPPQRQCVSKASPQLYVELAARNTGSEKFDVSADWACRCEPPLCDEKSYLGYLRVDGRVGLDRDFWEGALGLTVVDNRLQPAVDLPRCSSQAAASRVLRQNARTAGALAGRVRRILTKRNGKDAEKLAAPIPPTAALLKTLLDAVAWPESLRKPPVEEIRRPKEIELEVATRVTGLEEDAINHLEIAKAWKVEAEPLASGSVPTALVDQTADKVKVRLPNTAGPWKIHATVDLKPNDPNLPAPPPLSQVLWSDRLALTGSEMAKWIDEMTTEVVQVCDESVRSRAMGERERETARRRLPATVRNMLAETSRRREVTMTTLAILAYLKTSGCPEPGARSANKQLVR
jgi:hypothetical protein